MPKGSKQTNQRQHAPLVVDDEDRDLAVSYSVKIDPGSLRLYARMYINGVQQAVHRIIMSRKLRRDLLSTEYVDHIDGDGLNNRRENLRLCSVAENNRNRGKQSNNTSGYKGVCWVERRGKWQADIAVDGRNKYIGRYATAEDAARAYNEAAIKYHGAFARLNVIPD